MEDEYHLYNINKRYIYLLHIINVNRNIVSS